MGRNVGGIEITFDTSTNISQSGSAPTSLHDFHGAGRFVHLKLPLLQRLPELIPADDINLLAAAFREPNSVRALDAARFQHFRRSQVP